MIGGIYMKSSKIKYIIKQIGICVGVITCVTLFILTTIYVVHYIQAPIGENTLSLPYDTVAEGTYEFKVMTETSKTGEPWEYYVDTLLYESYKDKVNYTWNKQLYPYTELENGYRRYKKIIEPNKLLYPVLSVDLISYEDSPFESFHGSPYAMPFGKVVIQIEKW